MPSLEFLKEPLKQEAFIFDLSRIEVRLTVAHLLNELLNVIELVTRQLDAQEMVDPDGFATLSIDSKALANHSEKDSPARCTSSIVAALHVCGELHSKGRMTDPFLPKQRSQEPV